MKEAIEFFEALKQDEYAFTARDKEMFDVAIQALSYDDAKYHEEHGEVVVDEEIWDDANKAFLYEQTQRSMVEDIRAEIERYEADCRFAGGTEECEQCNTNVFGSIYQIIDRHMGKEKHEADNRPR